MIHLHQRRSPWRWFASGSLVLLIGHAAATGFYGSNLFLDQGGKSVDATPEFYWELEVKRLAQDFKPTETWHGIVPVDENGNILPAAAVSPTTRDADLADFAAALKEGRIVPANLDEAKRQNAEARDAIFATPVPAALSEEFASEFSDYHRGALAYRQQKWEEAKTDWLALLQRPESERHYRTVWATFMLGKTALKMNNPEAVRWFQETRKLAKGGFADALGMAADSYGWEARGEWKQDHPEKAAPLYLTQFALGDRSAIISLKALIPDRLPVEGMLNYGAEPEERESWTAEKKQAENARAMVRLEAAARDPLLRRLVTAHILATESGPDCYGTRLAEESTSRCTRWLSIIKKTGVEVVEDAEYLGWVAYTKGSYKEARGWLEKVKIPSPASLWLAAKLLRREGKLEEATQSMGVAWSAIRTASSDETNDAFGRWNEESVWSMPQSASGDLGALYLLQSKFVPALNALHEGGLWEDAAFVAERILTADELKSYVDAQPAAESNSRLRYLLGRRLVREDRYQEAAAYLPPPYNKVLAVYAQSLADGANKTLSKSERAHAWFKAAWIARYDGMEIMGTEGTPDGFVSEGSFASPEIAAERKAGHYIDSIYEAGEERRTERPLVLKPTREELKRLAKNQVSPEIRFHYRIIAGALAMRAAGLMEDNSEELADVLNSAGNWVQGGDDKTADRYYSILEKRAAQTVFGMAILSKKRFTQANGPWSTAENAAHETLLQK